MFPIDSLQRLLVKSISGIIVTIYILLTMSSDHFPIVQPSYGDRLNESLLASQHYNHILKFAKCQTPFPRVVNINSELHPSAIKKYIPHCTILHFCGPHSGCCRQENEQCVPKTIEEVKLYFWTIELTPRGHKKGIEVITMKNHTECICAPINSNHGSSVLQSTTLSTTSSTTVVSEDFETPLPSVALLEHVQTRNDSD